MILSVLGSRELTNSLSTTFCAILCKCHINGIKQNIIFFGFESAHVFLGVFMCAFTVMYVYLEARGHWLSFLSLAVSSLVRICSMTREGSFLKPANIGSICYQLVISWFSCIYCSFPARSLVKGSNTPREIQFKMILPKYQCSVKIILSTKNKYSKFTF